MEEKLSIAKERKQTELVAIGGKLEMEYENKVQKMLNKLKQDYEMQMTNNQDEFSKKQNSQSLFLETMLSEVSHLCIPHA